MICKSLNISRGLINFTHVHCPLYNNCHFSFANENIFSPSLFFSNKKSMFSAKTWYEYIENIALKMNQFKNDLQSSLEYASHAQP